MRLMPMGDDWVLTIQPPSKCKIANGLELTLPGRTRPPREKNIMPIQTPLDYLMAVKAWVWTLALAGKYQIERSVNAKSEKAWMVETSGLLAHWAKAEASVFAHMSGPQTLKPRMLLEELRKHDRAIRAAWAAKFRKETTMTYSKIINNHEMVCYADNAWKTSYAPLHELTAVADEARGSAYSRTREGSPPRKGDKGSGRRRRRLRPGNWAHHRRRRHVHRHQGQDQVREAHGHRRTAAAGPRIQRRQRLQPH